MAAPSWRPYTHFTSPDTPKTFKRDFVTGSDYVGTSVGCNAIQTYDGQIGLRKPYPAGTSVRVTSFYGKTGVRSFRTEQGFKDLMGVPTYTEKHPRKERSPNPRGKTPRIVTPTATPEPELYLHPFTQPDLNDPRFDTPGMYKTSYKRDYLQPGSNVARPAGKSYFRLG
ncbi:unnamed protein product [Amoebophrya sp. A120]|nr:unnamed protein product [Amoebophrya sp. A120]|eukprot:GSA120T00012551001.1